MNSTEESIAGAAVIDLWLAPPRVFSCRKYGYYIPDAFLTVADPAFRMQLPSLQTPTTTLRRPRGRRQGSPPKTLLWSSTRSTLVCVIRPCPGSFGRFSLSECSHVFLRGRIVLDTSVDENHLLPGITHVGISASEPVRVLACVVVSAATPPALNQRCLGAEFLALLK